MSYKLYNIKQKGFTLIEVMIVLAIVGILLLAIFLVVPAAQRGSRNTGRRNDVSKLIGIINEHITNNGGYVLLGGTTTICGGVAAACPATPTSNNIQITNETFSQYTTGATFAVTAAGTNPQAAPTTLNAITVFPGTKCSGADSTTVGASGRQFTATFLTETASGTTKSCIES